MRNTVRTFQDLSFDLVDNSGRVIPQKGMRGVVAPNRHLYARKSIDLSAVYRQVTKYFPDDTVFVSEAAYKKTAEVLLAELASDKQVKNLLKGWYIPLPLPQMCPGDYGEALEQDYLPLVERAYKDAFPVRRFDHWLRNNLFDKVVIADERHGQFVQRAVREPTVGIYFANPFQGFGVEAVRSMIQTFPSGYSLSGGFDAAVAQIAYPQIMAHGINTPATDCAAVGWRGSSYSLSFDSREGYFYFGIRLLGPFSNCSSGLLFSR